MRQDFKDWIIEDVKDMSPEQKRNFLHMLKFEPDKMVDVVAPHIADDWAMAFVSKTGRALIINDPRGDAQDLLADLSLHFAAELAATTQ